MRESWIFDPDLSRGLGTFVLECAAGHYHLLVKATPPSHLVYSSPFPMHLPVFSLVPLQFF